MSIKMMVKRERPVDALFHPKPVVVPPPKVEYERPRDKKDGIAVNQRRKDQQ